MEVDNKKNDENIIPNDADKPQKGVNVPNLRFKEYYENWTIKPLGAVCKFLKGRGISKEDLSNTGNPCILYGELYTTYKTAIIKDIKSKTLLELKSLVRSKSNDVLIPCSGETAEDIATSICVPYDDVLIGGDLTIIRSELNGAFLSNQINSVRKLNIAKVAQGKSIVHLQADELKKINISFPRIAEQQKIANFIDLLDQRIDTQSKIIEDLELFEKEINNTIINKLVEHKDLVKFSSLYNFAKEGGTPNTSHPEYYTKGSIPFVKIDDLTTKYLVSNQSFITKLGLENSSAWLIPANSILYSNGATIGAISINKYPVTTKQGILGIVPKSDYLSDYLYYFLRSNYFKKEICRITTQGTMKSAYIKDIDNILVPHVNKNQQNEILTLLSEITLKIEKEKDILKLYKKQKAYLLKNMFI